MELKKTELCFTIQLPDIKPVSVYISKYKLVILTFENKQYWKYDREGKILQL